MQLNFKEIFTAFMVLFAVIDIVGNIPIIIDLRKKVGHIQSEKASVIAGVILIAFLFLGKSILNLIGIDVNSFAVAGAFILFFIALTGRAYCGICLCISTGISSNCRSWKFNHFTIFKS
jgi:multiple antibiotic resistance protein